MSLLLLAFNCTDDILIWEIANGVFPLHDFISKKIKLTGSRCVSLKEKLRYFPKKGNRITVMSLWHKDLNHKFIEQSWESTMGDLLLPLLRSWSNVRFRHEVTTFIRAAFSQRPWKIKIINEDSCGNIYRRPRFLKKRMFCTEALAKVYQYLGLLSPTYNTKLIVPGDFAHLSQDSSYISIPLLHSWRLIPYMSIKLSEI